MPTSTPSAPPAPDTTARPIAVDGDANQWPVLTRADVRGWFRVTRVRLELTLDQIAGRMAERHGMNPMYALCVVEEFERGEVPAAHVFVARAADVFASFEREAA